MLAIIPARGGSKTITGKNIIQLCGKPLIAYTIEAAQKSELVDRIVLSTDDKKIMAVARNYNVDIPFRRPDELAKDTALAIDNFIYTIDRLKNEFDETYEEFVVLQPTSPLREAEDIDNALTLFFEKEADSVISVSETTHPPLWAKKIDASGRLRNYFDFEAARTNRQALEKAFMPNGAIFVFKSALLKEKYTYSSDKTFPYIMPKERSIDIDDYWDLKLAEFMIKKRCTN